MTKSQLTTEKELEIIEYYKTHSITNTGAHFKIKNFEVIKNILSKHGIPEHTKEASNRIKKLQREQTYLQKYGVSNPYQLPATRKKISERQKKMWADRHDELIDKRNNTNLEKYGHVNAWGFGTEEHKKAMRAKYGVESAGSLPEARQKQKETMLRKYGVSSNLQRPSVRERCQEKLHQDKEEIVKKRKTTSYSKYGVESYSQTEECKQKIKETCLNRYGVSSATKTIETQEKMKRTMLDKYGVDNCSKATEIKEKKKETTLKNYSVASPLQSDSVKEKSKNTCREKYGVEYSFQSDEVKKKSRKTCLKKYGVEWYTQTEDYQNRKPFKLYASNGVFFDSFPELCFWLYCIENNLNVKRNPTRLSYYFKNTVHYYFPDFELDGVLIEIKGDYLFKKMQIENTVENAKYKCLLENKVKIFTSADYKFYIDWFIKKGYKKENFIK